jgi:hypothetical protein
VAHGQQVDNGNRPVRQARSADHRDIRQPEGFTTVSAKVPTNRNLIIFPDHLRSGSFVQYTWQAGHNTYQYRVDQIRPNGHLN